MGYMEDIESRGIFDATLTHNCKKHKRYIWGMPVITFLYAPRTSCAHGTYQPPTVDVLGLFARIPISGHVALAISIIQGSSTVR